MQSSFVAFVAGLLITVCFSASLPREGLADLRIKNAIECGYGSGASTAGDLKARIDCYTDSISLMANRFRRVWELNGLARAIQGKLAQDGYPIDCWGNWVAEAMHAIDSRTLGNLPPNEVVTRYLSTVVPSSSDGMCTTQWNAFRNELVDFHQKLCLVSNRFNAQTQAQMNAALEARKQYDSCRDDWIKRSFPIQVLTANGSYESANSAELVALNQIRDFMHLLQLRTEAEQDWYGREAEYLNLYRALSSACLDDAKRLANLPQAAPGGKIDCDPLE